MAWKKKDIRYVSSPSMSPLRPSNGYQTLPVKRLRNFKTLKYMPRWNIKSHVHELLTRLSYPPGQLSRWPIDHIVDLHTIHIAVLLTTSEFWLCSKSYINQGYPTPIYQDIHIRNKSLKKYCKPCLRAEMFSLKWEAYGNIPGNWTPENHFLFSWRSTLLYALI